VIISITSIGYGDFSPVSTNEYIFITIFALISSGVFGYILTQVGEIISKIND